MSIAVKGADCNGAPLVPGSGRSAVVVVRFGNRDPELALTHVSNGEWRATWRPTNASTDRVQVAVTALLVEGNDRRAGQATRARRVLDSTTPLVATSARAGQINAQLPYSLAVDETLQIEVRRGDELSMPEPFVVAAAQPGIFTENQSGSGQGIIVKSDQITLARPVTPAERGEIIVIYCTGLGAVDPPVVLGQPAPVPAAITRAPVKVTIGGKPAEVLFSGLTPGFAGLYQVNARAPADAPVGDAVEVLLEAAGQTKTRDSILNTGFRGGKSVIEDTVPGFSLRTDRPTPSYLTHSTCD